MPEKPAWAEKWNSSLLLGSSVEGQSAVAGCGQYTRRKVREGWEYQLLKTHVRGQLQPMLNGTLGVQSESVMSHKSVHNPVTVGYRK